MSAGKNTPESDDTEGPVNTDTQTASAGGSALRDACGEHTERVWHGAGRHAARARHPPESLCHRGKRVSASSAAPFPNTVRGGGLQRTASPSPGLAGVSLISHCHVRQG